MNQYVVWLPFGTRTIRPMAQCLVTPLNKEFNGVTVIIICQILLNFNVLHIDFKMVALLSVIAQLCTILTTLWPIWTFVVADIVVANMICGRYGSCVANMVVADMVCGQYG